MDYALGARSHHAELSAVLSPAGSGVHSKVEEPVTLDEEPFIGHTTETDISDAVQ